jgi:ABC-type transport system substrate-binding protein
MALAATACGGGTEDSSSDPPVNATDVAENVIEGGDPVDGGALVAAVSAETDGWNPHQNQWANWGAFVGSSFLEPLAKRDEDGTAQPWLAESFTPNAAFDEWTLDLREGVTFHNGEAFDAAAVKANLDDAGTAPLSGIALNGLIASTVVVDANTVTVHLAQPWAVFPESFLASQVGLMMAPAMLAEPDGGQRNPIGTGPFKFEEWTPDSSLITSRNDDYWREGEPHLDTLEFRVITDSQSRTNALTAGDVEMIMTQDPAAAEALGDSFQLVKNWNTEPAMLVTNTVPETQGAPNPLANQHARLALAYATDRAALADLFGAGVVSPTSPFSPDNIWGLPADQNGYVDFDPQKARDEIALYEEETGASGLTVDLTGEVSQTSELLQALQQQWQAVGIDAQIDSFESTAFIQQVVFGNFQVAVFPIYTVPDPDQNWYIWSSENSHPAGELSINFAHLESPEIDAALETGRVNQDPEVRKAAYTELVRELNRLAVNIWLYWTPHTLAAAENVGGLAAVTGLPWANHEPKLWWGELWITEP